MKFLVDENLPPRQAELLRHDPASAERIMSPIGRTSPAVTAPDPQPEQLASRLNGAVDALIRGAEG